MGMFDFLTQPVASAAGAALSFLGGQSTNQANVDLANANNQWSAQQYATRYQTQVKDLEAAGLNPMLAVSQGAPPAPQAQPVTLQNPYSSAFQTYNEGVRSGGGYQRDVASAGASNSSAKLNDEQVKQVKATTDKIKEEIKNVPLEADRLVRAANLLYEQANLAFQQQLTESQRYEMVKQTVANLKLDGTLKGLDISAANALDNLGRTSKELKPIVDILRVFLRK